MMSSFKSLVSVSVASVFILSCSTTQMYDGKKLPNEELALFKPIGIDIKEINGKPVSPIMQTSVLGFKPGKYTFKATLNGSNSNYRFSSKIVKQVTIDAKKGKRYALLGNPKGNTWEILVDENYNKIYFFSP